MCGEGNSAFQGSPLDSVAPAPEQQEHPRDISGLIVGAFILVMTLHLAAPLWVKALKAERVGGWMIARVDTKSSSHTITYDDYTYMPRINAVSCGIPFSDPWNNWNPEWKGWGVFGLMPPLIGGFFVGLFKSCFTGLGVWALINFTCLSLLSYFIFRSSPFCFTRGIGIMATFLLLSAPWFATLPPQYFRSALYFLLCSALHFLLFGRVGYALIRVECGLLTYLPYVLFLGAYWRWIARPNITRSILVGAITGMLGYFYFYHYSFAFLLLASRGLWNLLHRRWQESRMALIAFFVGVVLMAPVIINNFYFEYRFGENYYLERLDYSPGRIPPVEDYLYLKSLLVPVALGILYWLVGPHTEVRHVLLGELFVMVVAFFSLLHLRLLLGFMQATDHFWRYSLGIPATLWCVAVVCDIGRFFCAKWRRLGGLVYVGALLLPLLMVVRGAYLNYSPSHLEMMLEDWKDGLSESQIHMIEKLEAMRQVVKPGDGFISTDITLNYHVMVNLRARPFVAMGASPISLEDLTERYLIASYLTGVDEVRFPEADRKAEGYFSDKDRQLYLYVNFFQIYHYSLKQKHEIEFLYNNWDPTRIDWGQWLEVMANVRAVFTAQSHVETSRERLEEIFVIEKEILVDRGTVFGVRLRRI